MLKSVFDHYDIYDLVVDWNRSHLGDLLKVKSRHFLRWPEQLIAAILISDERALQLINQLYSPDHFMRYEWKRNLGIEIACYDEDNAKLPYPIKIVCSSNCYKYSDLPPSKSDEGQGL